MALDISWTKTAQQSFDDIYDYIEAKLGENYAVEFLLKSLGVVDYISEFPEMGTDESVDLGIKAFVLSKQISLFYRMDSTKLILLNFYDNRRNPKRRSDYY